MRCAPTPVPKFASPKVFVPLLIFSSVCLGATCEELSSIFEAGKVVPPPPPLGLCGFGGAPPRVTDLPAFCRVSATFRPSSDSDIKAEFWMPLTGWNGRLQPTAAGVSLGMLNYASMANILRTGAATATSDNGHEGGSASFALGHPEKLNDLAERAGHLTLVDAKLPIQEFRQRTNPFPDERMRPRRKNSDDRNPALNGRSRHDDGWRT
jgi:feruloyl esterase